ncbi:hypothetical protein PISL3812_09552 [Talaromyces islandicus]|uniref:RNA polymerase II holoenzyme cyclin-like subunit n=1 Tax=Talaromyces islandicus TaxID=28573 RepID=A0A0U1MBN7_TALIS|nr:hypothetical protein PISL3812_09552 [Talaromyces islandicus]
MNDSSSQHRPRRPVPAPSNRVILNAQKQWYFTDEELLRTPSLLDGMSMETEHVQRSKGVNFIMQVGIMLKLPQLTLTTAAVFMHRFFVRYSMVDQPPRRPGMHPYSVAAGCLFLASKVDENCRKIREVVIACCRVAQKNPDLVVDEQSKEFWKWKDTLLAYEDLCLEALCFDLQLEQPHKVCYDFLIYFGKADHKHLRNAAWAFLNDSNFTVLCLQFYPRTIAAAALWAGARLCDVAFEDDEEGRPWWEQIDVNLADVRRAVSRMTQLYENNTVHKQAHQYPTNSADSDGAAETTRIVNPHPIITATTTDGPAVTPNGRKRSREPEDDSNTGFSTSRTEESSSQLRVDHKNNTNSREPSPKRQRRTPELSSPNGHRPSSRIPAAARDEQYRRQHPLPRPPPVSASGGDSRNGTSIDPVQQRIDQIVHQGLKNANGHRDYTNNNNNNYYYNSDRDRDRDWDRDRDRYRDRDRDRGRDSRDRDTRRHSVATNTSAGSDKHHHQSQKSTRDSNNKEQRKGAAADDDAEEGEINSDREEGEVTTSTNPESGSAPHHGGRGDDDDDGGGSEEGEV